MPVKNAGEYLIESIDSILNQTYSNWQLIIINDHSNDNSLNIVKGYAKLHPNILIKENKEHGIIPALRCGLNVAKGQYITRMDADDIMDKNKLLYLYQALENKGKGWLSTGFVKYFASDKLLNEGYKKYENWLNQLTAKNNNFSEIYKECVIPSPCWMMLKEDLYSIGGFDADIYPEDYDLAFRMYSNKLKIAGVNKTIHHWRDYPERTSRNDPNYLNNTFAEIKTNYFIKNDYKSTKTLILWGAGKKGKQIAKVLIDKKINFNWVTDNPKKINKTIYDQKIINSSILKEVKDIQVIIAISSKDFNPFLHIKDPGIIFYFC